LNGSTSQLRRRHCVVLLPANSVRGTAFGKLAERLTELLNEVVTEQGRELVQLKKKYLVQAENLDTIELERIRSTSAKPPHYH
jgi:uncharacterized coiled-coil protein SlyX